MKVEKNSDMVALRQRVDAMRAKGWATKANKLDVVIKMLEVSGLSPSGLSKEASLDKGTLNKLFEEDRPSAPHPLTLDKLAKATGYATYEDFLLSEGQGQAFKIIEVPVMATAPGGTWSETVDHVTETVRYVPEVPGDYRGVRIRGRSISKLVDDGGIAIVDVSQRDPDSLVNQPVIIECEGEITAKVYRRGPERFEPYSDDPGFATIYPKPECKILGRIVDSVKRMPKIIR
jgi:SOS-response transcriptional repressor LexA